MPHFIRTALATGAEEQVTILKCTDALFISFDGVVRERETPYIVEVRQEGDAYRELFDLEGRVLHATPTYVAAAWREIPLSILEAITAVWESPTHRLEVASQLSSHLRSTHD